MKEIAQRIEKLRKSKKMNQTEMAAILGIGRAAYSKIETGQNEILTKHILKISEYFNVSTDWLLKGIEGEPPGKQRCPDFGKFQGTFKLMVNDMLKDEILMHTIFEKYFHEKAKSYKGELIEKVTSKGNE